MQIEGSNNQALGREEELLVPQSFEDEAARKRFFSVVVERYSRRLYWTIRRIVVCHDDADDVLQNVLIKVWRSMDNFEQRARMSTWLYRIAINESLDFLRRQRKTDSIDGEECKGMAARLLADEYFDGNRTEALLQEAIASLPDVQRVVFNLRYYDEMRYSDMSRMLGTSEGALKASYHIAAKKVAEYVKKNE